MKDPKTFEFFEEFFAIEDVLEFVNATVSVFLVIEFIIYTYDVKIEKLQYPEMAVLIYLTLDWFIFFYVSENRLIYPFLL